MRELAGLYAHVRDTARDDHTQYRKTADAITSADIEDGTITGVDLAASVAGDGLAGGGGSALSVNVDASTIEISSDTLRVKDDGIVPKKINIAYASTAARATDNASPGGGDLSYIDSGDSAEGLYLYNGSAWRAPWNLPWGVIGIGTHDSGAAVSGATNFASVTFTAVANRYYRAMAMGRILNGTGVSVTLQIYDNGTALGIAESYLIAADNAVSLQRVKTFSAGSVTLALRADNTLTPVSNTYSSNERPLQLIIEDIGPAGAPA